MYNISSEWGVLLGSNSCRGYCGKPKNHSNCSFKAPIAASLSWLGSGFLQLYSLTFCRLEVTPPPSNSVCNSTNSLGTRNNLAPMTAFSSSSIVDDWIWSLFYGLCNERDKWWKSTIWLSVLVCCLKQIRERKQNLW